MKDGGGAAKRNRGRGLIKAKQAAESADRENICQRNNYGSGTRRAAQQRTREYIPSFFSSIAKDIKKYLKSKPASLKFFY